MSESEADPSTKSIMLDFPITHISKNDKEGRRIVAGYASFDVIDRQNERITNDAMKEALAKFMSNPDFANVHVMHGNCAVGKVIESYEDMNGTLWETKVDEIGTFIVSELRDDIKRANQTWELIKDGKLKSYSLGGLALSPKKWECNDAGLCYWEIGKLELHEFSYVERPAVRGADFVIVKEDSPPKAMYCPLECGSNLNLNKQASANEETTVQDSETIIMPEDTQTPETEDPKPELANPEVQEETEKAEATPIQLEIKAMLEKVLSYVDEMKGQNQAAPEQEEKTINWNDYPTEKVAALQERFGEEKAFHLVEVLGAEAFDLVTIKAKDPEPKEEEPSEEAESEEEKSLEEIVEEKVEESLTKYAPVQKRTVAVSEAKPEPISLVELSKMSWEELNSRRGA
jgi:hypothetical protein